MGNSIFVSKNDEFKLSVYYTKDGKFDVKEKEEIEEADLPKYGVITVTFRVPNYNVSKAIMNESTVYDGQRPSLNFSAFNTALMTYLAKGWDVKSEDGEDIPYSFEKLNELRPDIALKFVDTLIKHLKENGIYESLILS
jgi:hypothetical protein